LSLRSRKSQERRKSIEEQLYTSHTTVLILLLEKLAASRHQKLRLTQSDWLSGDGDMG
jgi:hypothetical protein